ncbi:hypothetical protein LY632_13810 [Erythrobacter sp. SDW2]|uniref:hypothetical protein n=1 Tax=Erythrobacter sp. SDW2 TaxID=2907154 RepID=UPI001F1EF6F7|nr:hypothetical protein [Erythrobacter sp. SDW2]UIP06731.1 hypothetical protein LY632_13810 [Erythrobacter sp. SDW2]
MRYLPLTDTDRGGLQGVLRRAVMRDGVVLLASLALAGCIAPGRAENTFTVSEVVDHSSELEGQRINVIGTLSDCQPLSCSLRAADGYWLSIGKSDEFDYAAERFRGQEVVVAATFTGKCVSDPKAEIIAVCTDRSETLADPKILGLASLFRK